MTIYIDDSGTSPENAVAVAARWIAHTDSWMDFQTDWDKAREIDGINLIRCTWLNSCLANVSMASESLPLAFKIARVFGKTVEEVFLYQESESSAETNQNL